MRFTPRSSKVIPFNKGVNQNLSALELGSSELYDVKNYELSDGEYAGLRLTDGYEVYDGTALASETGVDKHSDGTIILVGDEFPCDGTCMSDNVLCYIRSDSTDGSTVIVDSSDSTPTINISAGTMHSTTGAKFYNTSLYVIPGLEIYPITDSYMATFWYIDTYRWIFYAVVVVNGFRKVYEDGVEISSDPSTSPAFSQAIPLVFLGLPFRYVDDIVMYADPDDWESVIQPGTDPYGYEGTYPSLVNGYDAREAVTAGILPPNSDNTPILAVFEYAEEVWCIKPNSADSDNHYLYMATPTGWNSGTAIDPEATGTDTQVYMYDKGRLQRAENNDEIVVFANGVSRPFMLYYDGTTETISIIDGAGYLPSSENDTSGTPKIDRKFPKIATIWEQSLFLAYPQGYITWCQTGADPSDDSDSTNLPWDPSISTAGYEYFEDSITNLVVSVSSMIIFCEHMIKVFKKSNPDPASGISFITDTYSNRSGALWNTAKSILGTILFCDDRGVSTLETTSAYGDFEANVISRNAQRTYIANKDYIVGTVVNRERNQYKVCTSLGESMVFTFSASKDLKGVTFLKYPDTPNCGYECKWFGGIDGNVYKLHEGAESFNNAEIDAHFSTSYFTYNTPLNFKTFQRGLLELSAEKGVEIHFKPVFDYESEDTPKSTEEQLDTENYTVTGEWASSSLSLSEWSIFNWGGAAEQREWIYFPGIAANMSLKFHSSTKFYRQHTFHNIIISYMQRSMDF